MDWMMARMVTGPDAGVLVAFAPPARPVFDVDDERVSETSAVAA